VLQKINHIALVVPDLGPARRFWIDVMGLELDHEVHVESQQVDIAFLPLGESSIELLMPTSEESGVAKYLEKRGPGFHHICFEVDDIDAVLAELHHENVQLIDQTARTGEDGKKYAFIHPKGTGGVLVELYQLCK